MVLKRTNPRVERRRHQRIQALSAATLNYDRHFIPCLMIELSKGGARVRLLDKSALPSGSIMLESARLGIVPSKVVWQRGLLAGLKFSVEMPDETVWPLQSRHRPNSANRAAS